MEMNWKRKPGTKKARRRAPAEAKTGLHPLARRILPAVMLSALVFALLLLPLAALILKLDLPQELLPLLVISVAALTALLAGYFSVRPTRKQGLPVGLLAAGALYLCILLLAWLPLRCPLGMNAVVLLFSMLLAGGLGGILAANKPAKQGKKW